MKLAIIPEGPLAYDGERFLYSEGEAFYIDRIASHFEKVVLMAHAFHKGDEYYTAVAHRYFEAENIEVIELPLKQGIFGKFAQLVSSAKILWKNLDEADCYYIFLPGYAGAMASLICRVRKKDYFVYLASDWPEEAAFLNPFKGVMGKILLPVFRGMIGWLQDSAVRGAKFAMTAGTLLHDKYKGYKTPVEETIPRLNWPAYKLFKRDDTCQGDVARLLFVGYLLKRKGADFFIDAIKVLKKRNRKIEAVLVGEGVEEAALKARLADEGLESVVDMKGHIPNGEPLIAEYRKADIFVMPSCSGEGFPRVLYEAMCQGLPIISSDICGIDQKLTRDQHVLFVPPSDGKAIADKVEFLLDHPMQRQKQIACGLAFMEQLIAGNDGGQQIADLYYKYVAHGDNYKEDKEEKNKAA